MNADLEDLKIELWLRRRNSGDITWTTKSGHTIPIKDMTDSHLRNTINMLISYKEDTEMLCYLPEIEDAGDRI